MEGREGRRRRRSRRSLPQGRPEVRRLPLALGPARAELRRLAPLQRALQEPAPRAADPATARSPRSGSTAPAARGRTASGRSTTGPAYFALIRELQPEAVISIMGPDARWIGNEAGVTRESEWSVIPVVGFDDLPDEKNPGGIARLDAQAAGPRLVRTGSPRSPGRAGASSGIPARSTSPSGPAGSTTRPRTTRSRRSTSSSTSTTPRSAATPSSSSTSRPTSAAASTRTTRRRLKELGDRLRKTFAMNLAEGASGQA
ncbi:MAG: hypothetical protein M0C28_20215 [Candidatus Moduliflexus flocculans]|nr:hypothetical protein [Candidatus Moduliflexus flocculans]